MAARILADQLPEAVKSAGIQISLTDEQCKDLECVRQLKSHSNFGASLGEIIVLLAKDYLDRNDPLRREVKPRSKAENDSKAESVSKAKNVSKPKSVSEAKNISEVKNVSETIHYDEIANQNERANHPSVHSTTHSSAHSTAHSSAPESASPSTQGNTTMKSNVLRKAIAPSVQNFVRRRAGDECEFRSESGQRSGNRFQTQVDQMRLGIFGFCVEFTTF